MNSLSSLVSLIYTAQFEKKIIYESLVFVFIQYISLKKRKETAGKGDRKGCKRHRTHLGNRRIESNKEDFFYCNFLLLIQGSPPAIHGENAGSVSWDLKNITSLFSLTSH